MLKIRSTGFQASEVDPKEINVVDQEIKTNPLSDIVRFTDLPTLCPDCQKPFGFTDQPKRRWQRRAKLVLLVGTVGSLICGICFFNFMGEGLVVKNRAAVFSLLLLSFGVSLIPVTGAAFLGAMFKKIVNMRCSKCGWKRVFVINQAR